MSTKRTASDILREAQHYATAGNGSRAEMLYRVILAKFPKHKAALSGLAALTSNGAQQPDPLRKATTQIQALLKQGKQKEALEIGLAVQVAYPQDPELANGLGTLLAQSKDYTAAIAQFRRALSVAPKNIEALHNLAAALQILGRNKEAIQTAQAAISINPRPTALHATLGNALAAVGRLDEAITAFETVLATDPAHVMAHDGICYAYERSSQLDKMAIAIDRANLACEKDNALILHRMAQLAYRNKDYKGAKSLLSRTAIQDLPKDHQVSRYELIGKSFDQLHKSQAAIDAFQTMNQLGAPSLCVEPIVKNGYFRDLTDRLKDAESLKAPWDPSTTSDSPIFLVGSPRSGTTLLDTILRAHPKISVLEEQPMIQNMRAALGDAAHSIAGLAGLSEQAIEQARRGFLETFAELSDAPTMGKILVDRMPLNLVEVPMIMRVFPKARFILALRHPCDCVLSCFMQNFRHNNAMDNFVTLKGSAEFYNLFMSVWRAQTDALSPAVAQVRYEDVIIDPKSALEAVMQTIGVDWHPAMDDHLGSANKRARIDTASYQQITQPLYQSSAGRWERYRAQFDPILHHLTPWIEHWGYSHTDASDA
ncbi:MAG: tetratricopeptide (TPR) repeat protein [Paracoccaceae bacterium]|jgi:tetratricopeptide (TPR) repeat protein